MAISKWPNAGDGQDVARNELRALVRLNNCKH